MHIMCNWINWKYICELSICISPDEVQGFIEKVSMGNLHAYQPNSQLFMSFQFLDFLSDGNFT